VWLVGWLVGLNWRWLVRDGWMIDARPRYIRPRRAEVLQLLEAAPRGNGLHEAGEEDALAGHLCGPLLSVRHGPRAATAWPPTAHTYTHASLAHPSTKVVVCLNLSVRHTVHPCVTRTSIHKGRRVFEWEGDDLFSQCVTRSPMRRY
jgi:hypothetical protein